MSFHLLFTEITIQRSLSPSKQFFVARSAMEYKSRQIPSSPVRIIVLSCVYVAAPRFKKEKDDSSSTFRSEDTGTRFQRRAIITMQGIYGMTSTAWWLDGWMDGWINGSAKDTTERRLVLNPVAKSCYNFVWLILLSLPVGSSCWFVLREPIQCQEWWMDRRRASTHWTMWCKDKL